MAVPLNQSAEFNSIWAKCRDGMPGRDDVAIRAFLDCRVDGSIFVSSVVVVAERDQGPDLEPQILRDPE